MYPAPKSKIIAVISVFIVAIGVIAIVGWIYEVPIFKKVFPGYIYIKFNTAVCISFVGVCLLITQIRVKKYLSVLYIMLSVLIAVIGVISLLQDIVGADWGFDQLFITDKEAIAVKEVFPGRMSANSAFCFMLFGLAFLALNTRRRYLINIAQYFLHAITIVSSVALIGYLYNLSLFYNFSHVGPVAVQTAIALFLSSIAATLLNPSIGITRLFTDNQIGNQMSRRLFVLVVIMVVAFGSFRVQTEHYYLFSFELGISVLTVCFLLVNLVIIWLTANWLNGIDSQRYEAEEEIKVMNEELEERVDERTEELMNLLKKFQESESKFRTLVEKSLVGVYISQNEKFTYVNPMFADIFGYMPNELINTAINPIEIIINEEDRGSVRSKTQARYQGEVIDPYQVNGKKKDGSLNRVEFYGSRIIIEGVPSTIGTMVDITNRTKTEEILKHSEANLKTIFDTTDTAYGLFDKNMNVMAFNKMAVRFLNKEYHLSPKLDEAFGNYYPKEGFLRFMFEQLEGYNKERLRDFIKTIEKVLNGNDISYEIDYPQQNGLLNWYYIRLFPIKKDVTEIIGIMVEVSDITERKNSENKLFAANKQIQGHIDQIKEIAWKQSHLIRGPVANLKGLAGILSENPTDALVLKYIQNELERLDNIIMEMADDASDN